MTGIYEILCTNGDDTLYTTQKETDHSFIADSIDEDDLRLYTKEEARSLIDYLTDMFFSEPTHHSKLIGIWNMSFSIGDKLYVFDEHKVSASRDDVIKYIMENTRLIDLKEMDSTDVKAITEPMHELLVDEDKKDTRKNPFTRSD